MDTTRVTGQPPAEDLSPEQATTEQDRHDHESGGDDHEGAGDDETMTASPEQGPDERGPRKRRRRKRKRGGGAKEGEANDATPGAARSAAPDAPRAQPRPVQQERPRAPVNAARAKTLSTLTAGLFSHLDDRPVLCKVEGCSNTWLWTAEEQIAAFGQPPPKRMCAMHANASQQVEDREVPCANATCSRSWTWPKSAQLGIVQKGGSLEPPSRVCDACRKEERELGDREIACRSDGCSRTWTWTKDAQLRHRAWLRHHTPEGQGPAQQGGQDAEADRGRRRRRRGKASADGPPKRLCQVCHDKLQRTVERETTCKVHGCTRTVLVDRESQLRAWLALGTDDLDAEAPLPKRMCEVCREFCRLHTDREVPCGRPGCDKSWTFKTGAQLQAFLAGRFDDPVRLCESCAQAGAEAPSSSGGTKSTMLSPDAERMPCVVPGCDGVWDYDPSTVLVAAVEGGELPIDRMCDSCRVGRGAPSSRESAAASADATPEV